LQRFIKAQIHRAERDYRVEAKCIYAVERRIPKYDGEEPLRTFWLTWPEIKILIEEDPDLNPGPYRITEALERSA
jgi:hypothetical protein